MCNQSLFKWWCHLHYSTQFLDIAHNLFHLGMGNSSLLNVGATYIIGELINLNIEILMETFENLLLQNCSTEFLDIAHK